MRFNFVKQYLKKAMGYIMYTKDVVDKVSTSGFSRGISNVQFEGENAVPDRCNFSGKIKIGYRTTLGYNNFFHGDIIVGKYCQIGADVAMHSTNHPVHYLSTYIGSGFFNGELKKLKETKRIEIGNDVWIGHNALIIGEVKVGNGAIIAAGAIVTKNVPPYAIVAGVPAKVIKKRFSENICNEIEDLQWWNLSENELERIKPLFFKELDKVKSLYE